MRPLCDIANDILDNWRKYAEPTPEALMVLQGLQCCLSTECTYRQWTGLDLAQAFLRIIAYTWVPTTPEIEPLRDEIFLHLFHAN